MNHSLLKVNLQVQQGQLALPFLRAFSTRDGVLIVFFFNRDLFVDFSWDLNV